MIEKSRSLDVFSPEEHDLLQEIMNIGFGSAAADLAGVIDIHVRLSVPTIMVIPSSELIDYIKENMSGAHEISIIEQNFWSKFRGTAMLAFTAGTGRALLSLIGDINEHSFQSDPMRVLEKEMLMEIGNILSGACVGKVAELLGDVVFYSPPRVLIGAIESSGVSKITIDSNNFVIILQTIFNFGSQNLSGCLFLIVNQDSITWLKQALKNFLSQFS